MQQLTADPHQLRALALGFERQATAIEQARTTASNLLADTFWEGRDADRFGATWHDQASRLTAIAQMLRSGAATLRQQADRQDAVSSR
ncbi:MAG: hypothetical protein R2761_00660 [Acidimicrobiales bacterium]